MYKTWSEIRSEILNLGFEQAGAYAENPQAFIEAVNRAMTVVAAFAAPPPGHCVIELEDTGAEQRFDIRAMTAQDGEPVFLGYAERYPVALRDPRRAADYLIDNDDALLLQAGQSGTVDVWFRRTPAKITALTPDDFEIEFDADAATLIPLLASFYLWQDEDERKAVRYRNEYEELKKQLIESRAGAPAARVTTAEGWADV